MEIKYFGLGKTPLQVSILTYVAALRAPSARSPKAFRERCEIEAEKYTVI
jgi:hypothetical protein